MSYRIITDSCCDFSPEQYIEQIDSVLKQKEELFQFL